MNRKTLISLCVGTAFSALGLYLAFRNVPLSAIGNYMLAIDYRWLLPAAAALALGYLVRAVRWRWLLTSSGPPRLAYAYHSIVISLMINGLLPGRVGELARPLVLKRKAAIPIPLSLAALVVERLLDLWALLILFLPTLLALAPAGGSVVHFGGHTLGRDLLIDLGSMALITALGLLAPLFLMGNDRIRMSLIAWMLKWPVMLRLWGLDRVGQNLEQILPRLTGFIETASNGLASLCNLRGFLATASASLIIWGLNALCFYFLSIGSPGIELSFGAMCGVMVMICLFIALPSVPGFWGLWEAAGVFALSVYGIPNDAAAGYALFSHAFNLIPVMVAGWLSCLMLGFNWRVGERRTTADPIESDSRKLADLK